MKKGRLSIKLLLLQIAILFQVSAWAQNTVNADSLMHTAHDLAIAGKYKKAIAMAEDLLDRFPEYSDAYVLKARVMAWEKNYVAAINEINKYIQEDSENLDAHLALCDFYRWNEDYESSKRVARNALGIFPENEKLLLQLTKADFVAEEYESAKESGNDLLEKYPSNKETKEILRTIEMRKWRNEIRLEHYVDGHNKPFRRRWHMSSIGYGRNTSLGMYSAKAYIGDFLHEGDALYDTDVSVQYSLEFYPKFGKYDYMYLNYAISDDEFFPKNRIGAEYYHVFKKSAVEISLGYRYMQFTPAEDPEVNVNIFTGTLAKYFRNYWVTFRPYVIDNGDDTFFRYSLSVRTFLKPEMSYVQWLVGTGTSTENPVFYTSGPPSDGLDTWRVEMQWKQRVSKLISLELEAGFVNSEFNYERRRNQVILRSAISFLF